MNELANWEQVKDQVSYYGFLDTQEAYQISMQCKIGLCIKNQPESMLVSHERKLFEYMAIGLPALFCNQGIYEDLNQKYKIGKSVKITDSIAVADAIESLLLHDEILMSMSENARQAAQDHFNWNREEKKLFDLYDSLYFS